MPMPEVSLVNGSKNIDISRFPSIPEGEGAWKSWGLAKLANIIGEEYSFPNGIQFGRIDGPEKPLAYGYTPDQLAGVLRRWSQEVKNAKAGDEGPQLFDKPHWELAVIEAARVISHGQEGMGEAFDSRINELQAIVVEQRIGKIRTKASKPGQFSNTSIIQYENRTNQEEVSLAEPVREFLSSLGDTLRAVGKRPILVFTGVILAACASLPKGNAASTREVPPPPPITPTLPAEAISAADASGTPFPEQTSADASQAELVPVADATAVEKVVTDFEAAKVNWYDQDGNVVTKKGSESGLTLVGLLDAQLGTDSAPFAIFGLVTSNGGVEHLVMKQADGQWVLLVGSGDYYNTADGHKFDALGVFRDRKTRNYPANENPVENSVFLPIIAAEYDQSGKFLSWWLYNIKNTEQDEFHKIPALTGDSTKLLSLAEPGDKSLIIGATLMNSEGVKDWNFAWQGDTFSIVDASGNILQLWDGTQWEALTKPVTTFEKLNQYDALPALSSEIAVSDGFNNFLEQQLKAGNLGEFQNLAAVKPFGPENWQFWPPSNYDYLSQGAPVSTIELGDGALTSGVYKDRASWPTRPVAYYQLTIGGDKFLAMIYLALNHDGSHVFFKYTESYSKISDLLDTFLTPGKYIPTPADMTPKPATSRIPQIDKKYVDDYWMAHYVDMEKLIVETRAGGDITFTYDWSKFLWMMAGANVAPIN
ncbi:MAG TPA: hypothetical protein VMR81_06270 [Patescibacteria group bacterium]|nr:hypothetical protein [Patescibacteria group bacterium]